VGKRGGKGREETGKGEGRRTSCRGLILLGAVLNRGAEVDVGRRDVILLSCSFPSRIVYDDGTRLLSLCGGLQSQSL
jgi:hypothetical protein